MQVLISEGMRQPHKIHGRDYLYARNLRGTHSYPTSTAPSLIQLFNCKRNRLTWETECSYYWRHWSIGCLTLLDRVTIPGDWQVIIMSNSDINTIIIPLLQIRKLRHRGSCSLPKIPQPVVAEVLSNLWQPPVRCSRFNPNTVTWVKLLDPLFFLPEWRGMMVNSGLEDLKEEKYKRRQWS